MRIGSLFSGYGGAELAVQSVWPDAHPAWFVEYDKHPSTVLAAHWPDVPNYGDVTAVDWAAVEPVDVLTGGYPCQPFSHAGQRRGTNDERHLFPYVAAAIGVLQPRLVLLENVAGHLTLGGPQVIGTLTGLGYSVRWGVVRASDAGAPHRRARLFIVAHRDTSGWTPADAPSADEWCQPERNQPGQPTQTVGNRGGPAADPGGERHGPRQDGAGLGRLDRPDAGRARQRQRARQEPRDQGAAATADADSGGAEREMPQRLRPAGSAASNDVQLFGPYADAVARWEHILRRPAPAPTEPGTGGRPRLNPAFVEFMMGLPAGWVTDSGIPRSAQLKALGNGIVPQQMALALRLLLDMDAVAVSHDDNLIGTPTVAMAARSSAFRSRNPNPQELVDLIGGDA